MAKQKGLRILHAGDIYLGRPFSTLPAKSSERRRQETKDTLKDLFHYVEEQQVHLVLFSGNLFDFNYVSYEILAYFMREMERMHYTQFIIAPGVADRLEKQCFYSVCHLPKNVHILPAKADVISLPALGVTVFGWGLSDNQKDNTWPMTKLPPLSEGETLVVCGCVGAGGQEGVRVAPDEIANSGAVLVALSDGEGFGGFTQLGNTVTAVSGWLESSSFSHAGFGGANLYTLLREGEMEEEQEIEQEMPEQLPEAEQMTYFEAPEEVKEEPAKIEEEAANPHMEFDVPTGKLTAERLLFGGRQYITETIDISGYTTVEEVEQALRDLVKEKGYGTETSLCIILEGHTSPEFAPPRLRDHTTHSLAELLSVDKTLPDKDEKEYIRDMSVRGELMRAMMPSILNGDEKTKENTVKALRIAFLALDNEG